MILVISTVKNEEEGKRIVNLLLDEKLIACGNIISQVKSLFFWNNIKEEVEECVLFLKTSQEKFPVLIRRLKEIHSYELPEIIAIPINLGDPIYLKWIEDSTK
ncbi:MAG: divalent-cation tolerance protein CutA [Dictyoglomus sp.]|nr:divalent-cation tolerance protein CutA [Dictyoglomus sp.]MCX7942342.1 divalent-cation tolerance protein CutA [Dictyoglomaceae bacterium]MDW8188454.1 divalent-cation tolerance protein CutA [Dictyoglomus sp.]